MSIENENLNSQIAPVNQPAPKEPSEILVELLHETGSVSTLKLKSKLREAGYNNVDEIVDSLNNEKQSWRKIDRSFYTPQKALELESEEQTTPSELETTCIQTQEEECFHENDEISTKRDSKRSYKERRLCEQYILPFLRALYSSDLNENREVAFCVQNERPSTQFRNVDLIALNWRDTETAEIVTVEAKLEFNAQVVQQAANYSRFSHRVWIAVVVEKSIEVEQIVPSLQESDSLLFEYILSLGLGVIACQPGRGGSYACYPVQWPQKKDPDLFEKQNFINSYWETFEEAGLIVRPRKLAKIA